MRCEFFVCVVTFSVCVVSFFCMRCEIFVCIVSFLFALRLFCLRFGRLLLVFLRCQMFACDVIYDFYILKFVFALLNACLCCNF